MKRAHRLSGRHRFEQVRRQGACYSHRLVVLCALPNGLTISRFGFSASKRVGGAVQRNQVRRRLREIIRLRMTHIPAGWDVALIARPAIADVPYRQVEAAVERLLRQAGLTEPTAAPSVASVPAHP